MNEPTNAAALQLDRQHLIAPQRVTVHVPREVAYNFDKMTQLTKSVLGKLGCDGCHSGRVIDWVIIQDFVVNPKTLQAEEVMHGGVMRF